MLISSVVYIKTLIFGLYEDENRRAYEWLLSLTGLLGKTGLKLVHSSASTKTTSRFKSCYIPGFQTGWRYVPNE